MKVGIEYQISKIKGLKAVLSAIDESRDKMHAAIKKEQDDLYLLMYKDAKKKGFKTHGDKGGDVWVKYKNKKHLLQGFYLDREKLKLVVTLYPIPDKDKPFKDPPTIDEIELWKDE